MNTSFAGWRSLAVLLMLALAAPALAQSIYYLPPPRSTLFDTSIRAAAMGGASAAVMWGEPGDWANPATLAGVSGVGWVTGHTHFRPGEDDSVFSSQRVLIGGGGLGISLMGQPISGLGKSQFDFGPIALPLGGSGPSPYDRTESWGVGVSPLRLIESSRKLAGLPPPSLTSYGEVAFGYESKESKLFPNPGLNQPWDAPPSALTEGGMLDWGASGRLALARWWGADAPFRLDLSAAYSEINVLQSDWKDTGATAQQIDRIGAALLMSPAPPSERSASPPSLPWWRPVDVPELSVGLAYDHEHRHEEPFAGNDFSVDHYGFEANVFRLLALRIGYVSDRVANVEGWTYGGGLSVPIGPWGSVGYQLASVPNAGDLDRPLRQGWSVWLDPTRFWSNGD